MTELLKSQDLKLDQQSLSNEMKNFDDDRNLWSDAQEIVAHATQIAWSAEKKIATQLGKLWYDPKVFGQLGTSLDGRVTWLYQARNPLEQTIKELTNEIKKMNTDELSIFETKGIVFGKNDKSEGEILSLVTKKLDVALNEPNEWLLTKINAILKKNQQDQWQSVQSQKQPQQTLQPDVSLAKKTQAQESLTTMYANLDLVSLNRSLDTKLTNEQLAIFGKVMSQRMIDIESFLINTNATKPMGDMMSKNRTDPWILLDVEYVWANGKTENIPFLTEKQLGSDIFEIFTWWWNKFASQETQLVQRANRQMSKLWDTIQTKRTKVDQWSNVKAVEQIQETKKNVVTGKEIKQGQEAQKETLDIIREEPWMKGAMESRTASEINRLVWELVKAGAKPWSANPFHDARWGTHVLEFDVAWTPVDLTVFDFANPWSEKITNLSKDQKSRLEAVLEASGNNDKLVARMNQQFDLAWTKQARESWSNTRQQQLDSIKNKPLDQLLSPNGDIASLTNQMKTLYQDESGTFGSIDDEKKMAMRKTEFLITELLAYCKQQIDQTQDQTTKNTLVQQYHNLNATFVAIISGTGNETMHDADALEMSLAEWEADRRIDYAITNIESELYGKSPKEMVDLYRDKMVAIASNTQQTDSFKKAVSYIHALGAKIGETIKNDIVNPAKAREKKSNTDQLFRLIQMMRDAWSWSEEVNQWVMNQLNAKKTAYDEQKVYTYGVHNDFKNLDTAKDLMHWLMVEGWVAQEIAKEKMPKGKGQTERDWSWNRADHIFSLLGCGNNDIPDQKWQEMFLIQLFGPNYKTTLTQPYAKLSLNDRALLDGLHTVKERRLSMQDMINAHGLEQWPQEYMKLVMSIMDESKDRMMTAFADALGIWAKAWLTGTNKAMYDAFVDMHGTGWWFDVSDTQYTKNLGYADMAGWMAAAIAATIFAVKTFGAWSGAAALAWSTFLWSLAWSSAWLAYELARGRGFENMHELGMEAWSTIAADMAVTIATLWLGKVVSAWFAKFGQWTKNLLQEWTASQKLLTQANDLTKGVNMKKDYVKWMAETGRDLGVEMPLGLYVEQQRQKIITGQTVSVEAMISEMWPLLGIMAGMKLNEMPTMKGKIADLDIYKQKLLSDIDTEINRINQTIDAEKIRQSGQIDTKSLEMERAVLRDIKKKLEGKKDVWWGKQAPQERWANSWWEQTTDQGQDKPQSRLAPDIEQTITTNLAKAQATLEAQTWPNKQVSDLFSLMNDTLTKLYVTPWEQKSIFGTLTKLTQNIIQKFPEKNLNPYLKNIADRFRSIMPTIEMTKKKESIEHGKNLIWTLDAISPNLVKKKLWPSWAEMIADYKKILESYNDWSPENKAIIEYTVAKIKDMTIFDLVANKSWKLDYITSFDYARMDSDHFVLDDLRWMKDANKLTVHRNAHGPITELYKSFWNNINRIHWPWHHRQHATSDSILSRLRQNDNRWAELHTLDKPMTIHDFLAFSKKREQQWNTKDAVAIHVKLNDEISEVYILWWETIKNDLYNDMSGWAEWNTWLNHWNMNASLWSLHHAYAQAGIYLPPGDFWSSLPVSTLKPSWDIIKDLASINEKYRNKKWFWDIDTENQRELRKLATIAYNIKTPEWQQKLYNGVENHFKKQFTYRDGEKVYEPATIVTSWWSHANDACYEFALKNNTSGEPIKTWRAQWAYFENKIPQWFDVIDSFNDARFFEFNLFDSNPQFANQMSGTEFAKQRNDNIKKVFDLAKNNPDEQFFIMIDITHDPNFTALDLWDLPANVILMQSFSMSKRSLGWHGPDTDIATLSTNHRIFAWVLNIYGWNTHINQQSLHALQETAIWSRISTYDAWNLDRVAKNIHIKNKSERLRERNHWFADAFHQELEKNGLWKLYKPHTNDVFTILNPVDESVRHNQPFKDPKVQAVLEQYKVHNQSSFGWVENRLTVIDFGDAGIANRIAIGNEISPDDAKKFGKDLARAIIEFYQKNTNTTLLTQKNLSSSGQPT